MIRGTSLAAAIACVVAEAAFAAPRPAAGQAERVEHRDPATAPTRGPSTALVTIELFFAPGSGMPNPTALRMLQLLQERHPARIRLIYRILKGSASLVGPSAALEAHAEGKFFELLDELGKQRGVLKKDDLLESARKVGVDPQRVALAHQFDQYRDVLDANQNRLERLVHTVTMPSVLFNAKPTRVPIGTITTKDLDDEYKTAYDRALDKLERGNALAELQTAFDDDAMWGSRPNALLAPRDDDDDRAGTDHPLATPPLALAGLPSLGKPGVAAAVPVVVLCRTNDVACSNLLRVVEPDTRLYPDEVRVVWAPWFDVARDDAAELTLLGDAALCAEAIGSNLGELSTSPGWVWVKEMYAQIGRSPGRKLVSEWLIDAVAARLKVDVRALSACRAQMAGTTLEWIAAARRAGVPRASVVVVIGGRIYDNVTDPAQIHELVAAELAPGVLGSLPRWHTDK